VDSIQYEEDRWDGHKNGMISLLQNILDNSQINTKVHRTKYIRLLVVGNSEAPAPITITIQPPPPTSHQPPSDLRSFYYDTIIASPPHMHYQMPLISILTHQP